MCEFIEELIRCEGEQLAEGVFEKDYDSLTANQRHLLRLAVIVRLGIADLQPQHQAFNRERHYYRHADRSARECARIR